MTYRPLLGIATLLFFLISCGDSDKKGEPVRAIKYIEVTEYAQGQQRRISGVVEASNRADLSFQLPGNVATVDAVLGARVTQHQTLATLDAKPYELIVNAARAENTKAKALLVDKKTDYEAKAKLYEDRYVAKSMVDTAYADYQAAEQNVESSKAQLELAERDLNNTVLKAPFNGEIAAVNIDPSMNVAAGIPVMQILGEGGLEVTLALPENLRPHVSMGMLVTVEFPSVKGYHASGTVTEIASNTADTNAFETKVKLDNTQNIYAGLTADVLFNFKPTGNEEAAFLIPASALAPADNPGEANVFVYNPETQTVHKRKIIARNIRENSVEVTQGLNYGDIIAVAGVHFLSDGQHVALYQGK